MSDIIAMHKADLVAAVTAEVTPLKAEIDELSSSREWWKRRWNESQARIRELEAALRKIRKGYNPYTLFDEIDAVLTPVETETEYGDAVNPQGCREGSRPPIPPDVSSHPVWVPKLDNADECANCGCTWDMHAAGKAWYCPRVFEQPQSDRGEK